MTRQLRNIIIAASVVVALVVVLLLIKFLPSSKDDTPSSSSSISTSVNVVKLDAANIKSVRVTNSNGEYTISKSGSNWTIANMANYPLSQSALSNIVTEVTALTATQTVEENASSLDQYGLTTPRATADILTTDDKTITLLVGGNTPTGSGTYLSIKGEGKVYVVGITIGDDLSKSTIKLIDLTLTNFLSFKPELLTDITLGGSSRTTPLKMHINADSVKALASSSSSSSGTTSSAAYDLVSPSKYQVDTDKTSGLTSGLQNLNAMETVSLDVSDKSLSGYGLKNAPYAISYIYDGKETVILFGNTFQKDGATYVYMMLQGGNVVYDAEMSSVAFYKWSMFDIAPSLVFYPKHIETVKTVTVTAGSESWTFNITGTGDDLKGTYGSKTLVTNDFKNLYQTFVYLRPQGLVEKSSDTVLMRITFEFRDSSTPSEYIEFRGIPDSTNPSQLDAYKVLCDANGETSDFYVKREIIDNIIQQCKNCIDGKTVPSPS